MKYLAHIPTEQYGFIEFEMEGSTDEAVQQYEDVKKAINKEAGPGLGQREWCRFMDVYVSTGSPPEDGMSLWQDMDMQQRITVNEVKKTMKRLTSRNGREIKETKSS